jgi:hypothetical protein
MALALVRGGFRLLTDEYALLWTGGAHRGQFSGILVQPRLAAAPGQSLKSLERTLGARSVGEKKALHLTKSQVHEKPVSPAMIVVLESLEKRPAAHRARLLNPNELIPVLLSQLLDPVRSDRQSVLENLLALAESVPAYRVAAGTNLKSLLQFVGGLSSLRSS